MHQEKLNVLPSCRPARCEDSWQARDRADRPPRTWGRASKLYTADGGAQAAAAGLRATSSGAPGHSCRYPVELEVRNSLHPEGRAAGRADPCGSRLDQGMAPVFNPEPGADPGPRTPSAALRPVQQTGHGAAGTTEGHRSRARRHRLHSGLRQQSDHRENGGPDGRSAWRQPAPSLPSDVPPGVRA